MRQFRPKTVGSRMRSARAARIAATSSPPMTQRRRN
jgi:hypothetical protein